MSDNELKVFIATGESTCAECGEALERGACIHLAGERGALCLACADLDHLFFLPAGDPALTRRARKRYERQGLLVEEGALDRAEAECLGDAAARELRREREAERRAGTDQAYMGQFATRVRELYPACPPGAEQAVAQHACLKYSGRIGRTAGAKALDEEAVRLAVVAHVRHTQTAYDELLAAGCVRDEARDRVRQRVEEVLAAWGDRP